MGKDELEILIQRALEQLEISGRIPEGEFQVTVLWALLWLLDQADCYLNNELWEMKAPKGATLDVVDRNLRRAAKKSRNVIFDSRRVKNIPDAAIERELKARLATITKVDKIKFITRHAKVIDIV